jgi:two-component system sensor histidine kinase BarA
MGAGKSDPFGGIRARLIALALIPLAVSAVVIAFHGAHHAYEAEQWRIDEMGPIAAAQLAVAAQFPLNAGRHAQLQAICDATVSQPDLVSAEILDASFNPIASTTVAGRSEANGRRFLSPIVVAGGAAGVDLDPTAALPGGRLLGWAQVGLSTSARTERELQHLLDSLLIILCGLVLSILAALKVSAGLLRGLRELTATLLRFRRGDLSARATRQPIAELDTLARGVNRMANSLARSQKAMRNRVDAATRDLRASLATLQAQNTKLEDARAEALRAGREKEEFLARMSHELRTPLNAVIGFARLMHEETRTDNASDYSRTLDRAAHQLLTVIDDILEYVKLKSKELPIESVSFDPRACCDDVVAMLAPEAYAKGLELALAVHGSVPPRLIGAPSRLTQVLLNLLNNAIEFTDEGHVFLEATFIPKPGEESGSLRVTVADTGIGMSEAQQQRVFRPFEQASAAIEGRYGGTGLGLAVSKRLVDLMDGEIAVRSRLGRGTRFTVTLPCRSISGAENQGDQQTLRPRKVLVCDPAPIQVRALRSELLGWSMEVFTTNDPTCLPAMLHQAADSGRAFELLILGISPTEPNIDLLERRLADARSAFAGPILLLVGDDQWRPPARVMAHRPLAWTRKPLRRSRLLALLRQLDEGAPTADAIEAPAREQFPGRRALVADDNGFNRTLIKRLLELRGFEVIEADDGAEAVRIAPILRLDLIVMDTHMPVMDGIEAARRLRAADQGTRSPRIIAVSADAVIHEPGADPTPVFDAVLLKPISEAALDAALTRLFGAGSTAPARGGRLPATPPPPEPAAQPAANALDSEWRRRLPDELAAQLAQIRAAIAAEDRTALQERLHDLKGLCGLLERPAVINRVRRLEAMAAEAPMSAVSDALEALAPLLGAEDVGRAGAAASGE